MKSYWNITNQSQNNMTKEELKKRKQDILKMRKNRYKLKDIAVKHKITLGRVWQIIKS